VALLIVAAGEALATAGEPARLTGDACLDRSGQLYINLCETAKFKKADTALNQAYRSLMSVVGEADRDRLKAAQRAWIAYRDAECNLEARPAGGSMDEELMSACLADLTKRRLAELKEVRRILTE
jgi:uncharacterized protein YecT (DUF1311 family)